MAERPNVDVVVPFAGPITALEALRLRLAALRLRPGDSVVVVDNTPRGLAVPSTVAVADGPAVNAVGVLRAAGRHTPGYARNRGAEAGAAEWIVFLDADSAPASDLLDRYFDPPPAPRTALLAGGLIDEQVPVDAPMAARYAYVRRLMNQEQTFDLGRWGFPKSANVACRRVAFDAIRGFKENIRAGEDADFTYRLRAAGWEVERREAAVVVHLSRRSMGSLLKQQALWGSGAAWLAREYPGSMPLIRNRASVWSVLGEPVVGLARSRWRDRDAAIYALVRPLEALARRLGRLLPNERPRSDRGPK